MQNFDSRADITFWQINEKSPPIKDFEKKVSNSFFLLHLFHFCSLSFIRESKLTLIGWDKDFEDGAG